MNHARRSILKTTGAFGVLFAAGILTSKQLWAAADNRATFEAKSLTDALKSIGGTVVDSKDVSINAPDIAENGAVVPITVSSTLAKVQEIYILVEKNPFPLAASFILADGTEPSVQTRIKMGQSSNVVAVVKADGKLYTASKETKVTLGGCGG
jgi:sulfur-oxidizing protein SoxY